MGAWEPIIIQLDATFEGDLHQKEGQQGGRKRKTRQNEGKQEELWWPEEYKTNGGELEL